jgi:hypothetical integral membrane protein (TIGR02206 family)
MPDALSGAQHLVTVALFSAAVAGMCWTGRRLRGTAAGKRYEHSLAAGVCLLWFGYQAYDIAVMGFHASHALPLQMSDVTAAVAGLIMVWPYRGLQALAYFFGIALGTQAVFTPDLAGGPDTISFWAFWLYHVFVVGSGVYVVVVQGFRPQWRDLRFALLVGWIYVAVVFTIDAVFDLNYGYLGRATPSRPTLLDVLGPWPMRVVYMVILASAGMTLLLIPWLFARRVQRPPSG